MRKVTIEDISQRTGLSRGTVSRALNDRPDISQKTKHRVLEACRELNYVPNHAARSLATGRNYAVAVLLDDLTSVFAASYLRGVIRAAEEAAYAVQALEIGSGGETTRDRIRALSAVRIDSLLIGCPIAREIAPLLLDVIRNRVTASCFPVEGLAGDVFTPDFVEAGRVVGRVLLSSGASNLLYVHRPDTPGAPERLTGFQDVFRSQNLDPEGCIVRLDGGGVAAVGERLAAASAIGCSDDFVAIEVMFECHRRGRLPGRDVTVMGQGNERVGARISPSLTSLDFAGEEIGRRSFETAHQRIMQQRQDAPQHARIAPTLIRRASSGGY